jgi:hypothetical protein
MIWLIYAFLLNGQPMLGMAEFDTYERCVEQGIPEARKQYPDGDAHCFIVKR